MIAWVSYSKMSTSDSRIDIFMVSVSKISVDEVKLVIEYDVSVGTETNFRGIVISLPISPVNDVDWVPNLGDAKMKTNIVHLVNWNVVEKRTP